jgi:coenzyme F420-0:L-glutamate ligase/coenzyme F420-1:gamma-L-glutamate ligase
MSRARVFSVIPVEGLREITEGDQIGVLLAGATALEDGDIVVIAQKAISKAEGRLRSLADVEPRGEAKRIAAETGRDPRLVELILSESRSVLRATPAALITRTRHGFVCANAGIDSSNVGSEGSVLLLPSDPDASAREIRAQIRAACGHDVGVVVADSFGRAWRIGQTDVAIGAAGVQVTDDWRARSDAYGRELTATEVAIADQLAAAADLAREKDAGVPAVIIRGLARLVTEDDGPGATALRRAEADDLFT